MYAYRLLYCPVRYRTVSLSILARSIEPRPAIVSPVIERPTGESDFTHSRVKRWWMVLVAVVVGLSRASASIGFMGSSARTTITSAGGGISDQTEPFNPKHITLEVFGDPGTVATINYVDINVQPRQVLNAALPWSLTMVTTQPGPSVTLWRRAIAIPWAVASLWMVRSRTKGSSTK